MELVRFINCSDDGTDQIVSFALAYGETDIRSLILLRTPKYEVMLDENERGVSVALEDETGGNGDLLASVRIAENRVEIETPISKFDLDVSRVDSEEVSEMKALFERMNFDNRFKIENV